MKTLAVLSALATIAIAAPALEEHGDSTRLTSNDFTITQREKKSTLEKTLPEKPLEHLEDHVSNSAHKFTQDSSSARTFSGFKKPIIVKKKIGYHVYRDSDEEQAQADSRESCKEQIKVKLCDDINSVDKMKSASIHHTHEDITENQMKHSITMAKEAVETFQKDLLKMDHESQNNGHMHTGLGANKELREDIEKARQALEHIQRKFKNLDTDTIFTDGAISDSHLKAMKDEENRMTQWEEFVGNHKNSEIARNLEDNFKTVDKNEMPKTVQTSNFIKSNMKSIEDGNTWISSKPRVEKNEDDIISVVDKIPKMEIHSDSLKKEMNEGNHEEEKKHKMLEKKVEEHDIATKTTNTETTHVKHAESKNSAECNDNDHKNHQNANIGVEENKERSNDDKSSPPEKNNLEVKEKHIWDKLENTDTLKSSVDSPVLDVANHLQVKESELHAGHLSSEDKKDKIQEDKFDTSASTINPKMIHSKESDMKTDEISTKADKHIDNEKHIEDIEQRSTLLKQSPTLPELTDQVKMLSTNREEVDLHRSVGKSIESMTKSVKQSLLENEEKKIDMDQEKSSLSTTITKLDNEKSHIRNPIDEHQGNNEHQMAADTRASANFHKDLLNNMDFIEDSHQSSFDKHSPTETNHKLKNEKPELHERFSVPNIQPNTDHLKNMMQLSDNSQDHLNQRTQLKMATMFNNEQPNLNVQFNSPQTFEQQTNIQRLLPFKAAEDIHHEHSHNFDTMHKKGEISSDLHDPLQTRWAHENHLHKIKAASQFHQDNMEMGESSPHFSIDGSMPLGSSSMGSHHIGLSEQFNGHQRWMQEKNVNAHKTATANIGSQLSPGMRESANFEYLHNHGNSNMMHGKSMQMSGGPKTALEYNEPNQWSHNHGLFRSSYGPSSYGQSSYGPSSYGTSSYGPSSSGTSGSSASGNPTVGLFPNVNVGNYAVPLLLSCSPSVVSGRLAKTNTYNSAPAYRSEDINFLKKRDTDIALEIPSYKMHRHIPMGYQSTTILEKKH